MSKSQNSLIDKTMIKGLELELLWFFPGDAHRVGNYPDPDPIFDKKVYPDPTFQKTDPDPTIKKICIRIRTYKNNPDPTSKKKSI